MLYDVPIKSALACIHSSHYAINTTIIISFYRAMHYISVSQTTTSGISVGSSRRFRLCDAAAHSHVVFCALQMFLLTYLLTL